MRRSNSGKGRPRDLVAQRGLDQVYVDFLRQIHDVIQPTGKRVLFWGDLAWHNPDLVASLPKDMIGVPWVYDALPDFDKYIAPFNRAGMEVWVAPGVNNWRRVYPDNNVGPGQHPALRPRRPAPRRARHAQHRLE